VPALPAWAGTIRRYLLPLLLFAGALLLYLPRLSKPRIYIYDEVYHAYTAGQYVAGNRDAFVWNTRAPRQGGAYTWNHPPAGLLLIAAGIALEGDNPKGWRISSALFGAFGILAAYLLALTLTRDREAAQLAAALLLVDGLYFVQSRTAMLDIFGTVFMMGAFIGFYGYLTAAPHEVRGPLLWTGLFLGLAIATKWNAAYPAAVIGLVAAAKGATLLRAGTTGGRQHLLWVLVGLMAVPVAVYLAVHIPFFLTGHTWSQFVELQRQIYYYHTTLDATHPYQSEWWQWPLALRPVWYYVSVAPGTVASIYAQPNPLLYWAFVPTALWVSLRWWNTRRTAAAVLMMGFFAQWLPWALVPRAAFMYHFLPVAPFGVLAVAVCLLELWRGTRARRLIAVVYVAAVALSFIYFYPLYAALPLSEHELAGRMWIKGWR
jgi:dolichyl-phosphate-mannose--protein O-mannosyl transferase